LAVGDKIFAMNGENVVGFTTKDAARIVMQSDTVVLGLDAPARTPSSSVVPPAPPIDNFSADCEISPRTITLDRSNGKKIGIRLTSAHGANQPLTISSVSGQSVGKLTVGDTIIGINGENVLGFQMKDAAQIVLRSDTVVLVLGDPASPKPTRGTKSLVITDALAIAPIAHTPQATNGEHYGSILSHPAIVTAPASFSTSHVTPSTLSESRNSDSNEARTETWEAEDVPAPKPLPDSQRTGSNVTETAPPPTPRSHTAAETLMSINDDDGTCGTRRQPTAALGEMHTAIETPIPSDDDVYGNLSHLPGIDSSSNAYAPFLEGQWITCEKCTPFGVPLCSMCTFIPSRAPSSAYSTATRASNVAGVGRCSPQATAIAEPTQEVKTNGGSQPPECAEQLPHIERPFPPSTASLRLSTSPQIVPHNVNLSSLFLHPGVLSGVGFDPTLPRDELYEMPTSLLQGDGGGVIEFDPIQPGDELYEMPSSLSQEDGGGVIASQDGKPNGNTIPVANVQKDALPQSKSGRVSSKYAWSTAKPKLKVKVKTKAWVLTPKEYTAQSPLPERNHFAQMEMVSMSPTMPQDDVPASLYLGRRIVKASFGSDEPPPWTPEDGLYELPTVAQRLRVGRSRKDTKFSVVNLDDGQDSTKRHRMTAREAARGVPRTGPVPPGLDRYIPKDAGSTNYGFDARTTSIQRPEDVDDGVYEMPDSNQGNSKRDMQADAHTVPSRRAQGDGGNVSGIHHTQPLSEIHSQPLCEHCNEGEEQIATHHCNDCTDHFCKSCLTQHGKKKKTKGHSVVSIELHLTGSNTAAIQNGAELKMTARERQLAANFTPAPPLSDSTKVPPTIGFDNNHNKLTGHTRRPIKETVVSETVISTKHSQDRSKANTTLSPHIQKYEAKVPATHSESTVLSGKTKRDLQLEANAPEKKTVQSQKIMVDPKPRAKLDPQSTTIALANVRSRNTSAAASILNERIHSSQNVGSQLRVQRSTLNTADSKVLRDALVSIRPESHQFFKIVHAFFCNKADIEAVYNSAASGGKLEVINIIPADEVESDLAQPPPSPTKGSKTSICNVKDQQQRIGQHNGPVQTIEGLYAAAEAIKPEFEKVIAEIQNDAGSGITVTLPPGLKTKERTIAKGAAEYEHREPGPAFGWVYDVVRATLVCDTADQIETCLSLIQVHPQVDAILNGKNRFAKPAVNGSRDFILHVRVLLDTGDIHTSVVHVCEIQLQLRSISKLIATNGADQYYDYFQHFFNCGSSMHVIAERLEQLEMLVGNNFASGNPSENAHESLERLITNVVASNDESRVDQLAMLCADELQELDLALYARKKGIDATAFHLGQSHEDVGLAHTKLGIVLADRGDFAEATFQFEDALKIQESNLGPTHANIAFTLRSMADALKHQGKYPKALVMYKRALRIDEVAKGTDHPDVGKELNNMAHTLYNQPASKDKVLMSRRAKMVAAMYKKALAIREAAYGENHIDTATTLMNLAVFFEGQNEIKKALANYERALKIYEIVNGPVHPYITNASSHVSRARTLVSSQ
jgi:tetratricopeptide (TPR) repeat protein